MKIGVTERQGGVWKSEGFPMKGLESFRNPEDFEEAGFGRPGVPPSIIVYFIHSSIITMNKQIFLPSVPTKKIITQKPKEKRMIVSETDKWTFSKEELEPSAQYDIVSPIFSSDLCDLSKNHLFILQQIRNKISGYKSQDKDKEKSKYDPCKFVTQNDVLELFNKSKLACYYCNEPTLVLYEYVRDPKQWSLERLDNKMGHNKDNVVLACLQCNLRRRCIHSDRYLQTKQMTTIVKLAGNPSPP